MQITELFKQHGTRLKQEKLFFIFDRDGTLSPITKDPQQAFISKETKDAVLSLAACSDIFVAILSARSLRQLSDDFGNRKLVLAGNYGFEIIYPNGDSYEHQIAVDSKRSLARAKVFLEQELKTINGIILEDHCLSLCLHFHLVAEKNISFLQLIIQETEKKFPELKFKHMPTSYEVLPTVDWDKGKALQKIDAWAKIIMNQWLYICVGDSITDKPSFCFVNDRNGISIQIGEQDDLQALYKLNSPKELVQFIWQIIEIRKQ